MGYAWPGLTVNATVTNKNCLREFLSAYFSIFLEIKNLYVTFAASLQWNVTNVIKLSSATCLTWANIHLLWTVNKYYKHAKSGYHIRQLLRNFLFWNVDAIITIIIVIIISISIVKITLNLRVYGLIHNTVQTCFLQKLVTNISSSIAFRVCFSCLKTWYN